MTSPGLSLEAKVVLVTGSMREIDKAIDLVPAEAGASVAIPDYMIDNGELKAVVDEISNL